MHGRHGIRKCYNNRGIYIKGTSADYMQKPSALCDITQVHTKQSMFRSSLLLMQTAMTLLRILESVFQIAKCTR